MNGSKSSKSIRITGNIVVSGEGSGEVVSTDTPLSFWGGFNGQTGTIIDQHHPLKNEKITGKVFVLPFGRGSCTGSVELLEAIYAGNGPSAIILKKVDEIISLGAIVADEIFQVKVPIIELNENDFEQAKIAKYIAVDEDGAIVLN